MFEQQLYSFEGPAEPSKEGDLFHSYEIKSWNISTRIYQILAISLVLNLAILGFVGQAELLTTRGCESPFVGRVCQVLDMAYVGSVLFGTDREYVDAEYERTDLGDAEITYIDVSGLQPPFEYPEGYFYQEPTPETITDSGFLAPGIPNPTTSGSSIFDTQATPPKNNSNPVEGTIPDSPFKMDNDQTVGKSVNRPRGGRIKGNTNSNAAGAEGEVGTSGNSNSTATKTDPITGDEINNRPFTDFGKKLIDRLDKKSVDLQNEFLLSAKGRLNKDGKLDPKSFKYLKAESKDQELIAVVQEAIEAFNDSGRLKVLEKLSGKDLNLNVQQDATNITAVVQSEVESENRARSLASNLNILLEGAKYYKSGTDASPNDKDDLLLLNGAKIEADGKNLIIKFFVPKEVVHQMIERKLAKQREELQKPNGNAMVKSGANTVVK